MTLSVENVNLAHPCYVDVDIGSESDIFLIMMLILMLKFGRDFEVHSKFLGKVLLSAECDLYHSSY